MQSRRRFLTLTPAFVAAPALLRAQGTDGPVRLRTLYNPDQSFSDLALALEGERIDVDGYMAPPLVANSNFYVLTKMPMSVCPFCETSAEWPDDIVAVYARRVVDVVPFNAPIVTTGELSLGTYTDPDLGFVSRVRLMNAATRRV